MIELSSTLSAGGSSTKRWWRILSTAFPITQAAQARLLILVVSLPFSQTALARPVARPAQTSNTIDAMKLMAEAKRLADLGTRAAMIEAIYKSKAAYELFRKDDHRVGMGMAQFVAGASYSSLGQNRRALEAFLDASIYTKETADPSLRATILAIIGLIYTKLSEWKPAIEYLDQALVLFQTEKNPEMIAPVLGGLGATYIRLGQKRKGIEYVNRALNLFQETDDRDLEAKTLAVMGGVLSSIGQNRKALEWAQRALQIARQDKNRSNEAFALSSLGEIHNLLGDRQSALRDYDEALRVGLEANDRSWKPTVLSNMASIYLDFGEIDRSTALYEESIRASETEGEPENAALGLNGLALISERQAAPLKALSYYQRVLALARAFKHQDREAAALANIAGLYASFDQHELALKGSHDAVAAFSAIEDAAGEATALANIGAIYNKLDRHSEALNYLNRALERQRAMENREGQAHTLLGIGDAHRQAGDLARAYDAYTESLALMTEVEDRLGVAMACSRLGLTYHMQGNYQKAYEYYLRALPLTRSANDRRQEALSLVNLGLLHEDKADLKEAESFYEQATAVLEQVRTAARLEEFKTAVADQSADLYSQAILLKIKLGKAADAFELSERARARTLLDQINGVRIDMRKSADRELIEQEQALRFEMASLEKKLQEEMARGGAGEACGPLEERLKQGRQAYAEIIVRLKASNPEYAELQGYLPVSHIEIQRLLRPETTLLSYYVTASKTLIFVVTRDSLKVVEAPVGEKELRNSIDWFRSFASLRSPESAGLRQLYAWLIAPVRQHIKTPRVCVIPHGILHQLPFAALNDGKGYFGDQHTIYYLPAASLLPSIERRSGRACKRLLALAEAKAEGQPSLRYVDYEAETMARLYQGKALLSGQASKAEFLRLAADYDILHIASHAELNTRSPLFSRILLTPTQNGSQALEVREIYDLDLSHTSLVMLSACETQLGAQSRGDEIVGLNRAFIYAGASTVIASLWRVDDRATSLLMRSFYTHLKRGMGKAQALRMAQSETRRQFANPYYWAAFVLTGEAGLSGPVYPDGPRRKGVHP